MIPPVVLAAASAVQLATEGKEKVVQIGGPLAALAIALLVLTITIMLIAYISGRLNDSSK